MKNFCKRPSIMTLPTSGAEKVLIFHWNNNLLLPSTWRVKGLLEPHTFSYKQNHLYILKYTFLHISWKNLQTRNKCSNTTRDHRSSVEQCGPMFKPDHQNTTEESSETPLWSRNFRPQSQRNLGHRHDRPINQRGVKTVHYPFYHLVCCICHHKVVPTVLCSVVWCYMQALANDANNTNRWVHLATPTLQLVYCQLDNWPSSEFLFPEVNGMHH